MDFASARRNMVESQLRTNRITEDSILAAMGEIPRERFVPEEMSGIAYVDEDLQIGSGRCLMEPMVLGRMLQETLPDATEAALSIGCGTGYSAAVLARLCAAVFALESDAALAVKATSVLAALGADNAVVVEGPLDRGWPDDAPYNLILFNGAVSEVPPAIADQLSEDGRLVAVIVHDDGVGHATLIHRRGGVLARRVLFDASVPVLPSFEKSAGFVF